MSSDVRLSCHPQFISALLLHTLPFTLDPTALHQQCCRLPACKQFTLIKAVNMSTNSAPSSPSAGLAYLQDTSEFLRSSTDMLIIVEGTALPCHKQVLAAHSKAFAAVAEQLTASLGHGVHRDSHKTVTRHPADNIQNIAPGRAICGSGSDGVVLCSCRRKPSSGSSVQGQAAGRRAAPYARHLQVQCVLCQQRTAQM